MEEEEEGEERKPTKVKTGTNIRFDLEPEPESEVEDLAESEVEAELEEVEEEPDPLPDHFIADDGEPSDLDDHDHDGDRSEKSYGTAGLSRRPSSPLSVPETNSPPGSPGGSGKPRTLWYGIHSFSNLSSPHLT
jgi:hypothetical protein